MLLRGRFGAVRANQCDQFPDGDFEAVLALDADLALIKIDEQHALPIRTRLQVQRADQAPGLGIVLRQQPRLVVNSILVSSID
jgi:hypothetical protein